MTKRRVANGIFWVEIPDADLRILCGCPADSVKHLLCAGLIAPVTKDGVTFETGPNAILLSDTSIQQGSFANLAEFPLLQMFYRQGMLIPGHPGNTGRKPLLIGLGDQVRSQAAYVFRGNYGLSTVEEIEAAGVPPQSAREMIRVKKWFAFDRIRRTEEMVDIRALDADAVPLAPGVVVHRKGFNRYEFISSGQSVEVDLTLAPGQEFEPPYVLPPTGVKRDRFSVIHIGEGDGWDPRRPSMGSIVCSEGLLYLVDAAPHITRSLDALGLGVGDIEGIFHTHAHDDHFAGLTSLVRSDMRLKYFAAPCVRESVQKKLAALMRIDENSLSRFFDVHDLRVGEWNPVGGMEVRPALSLHPVETTVLFFRSGTGAGRRTYAHLADIASREVVDKLARPNGGEAVLSAQRRRSFEEDMNWAVDVKKVDAGGGLIHGNAGDFAADLSDSVILSHGIDAVPPEMLRIAHMVAFGDTDVLVPGETTDFMLRAARASLSVLFPGVPGPAIEDLAACPTRTYQPGAVLKGAPRCSWFSAAQRDETDPGTGEIRRRRAGSLLGAPSEGMSMIPGGTQSVGSLVVLVIPMDAYVDFASRERHATARRLSLSHRGLLSLCPLFAQVSSENVLNAVAASMEGRSLKKGATAIPAATPEILLLADGEIDLVMGASLIECIGPGGFWGEERLVSSAAALGEARGVVDCRIYAIPAAALTGIPIVQWAMQESFERRLRSFRSGFRFEWSDSFRVDVRLLDDQHQRLFALVNDLSQRIGETRTIAGHGAQKIALLECTREHFTTEENLMALHRYPRLVVQRRAHGELLMLLEHFIAAGERRKRPRASTAVDYLKDWLIRHTLIEDLQYRPFFARKGVT